MAAEGHSRTDIASSPPGDLPVDFESSVRRLLHELHLRQHEPERRASNLPDVRATSDVLMKAAEAIERLKRLGQYTDFEEIAMRNGNFLYPP
jgi:hypothetical protein